MNRRRWIAGYEPTDIFRVLITSRYIKRNNWFLSHVMIAGDKCFVCASKAIINLNIIVTIRKTLSKQFLEIEKKNPYPYPEYFLL